MRNLDRNKTTLYYALQTGVEAVTDSNGFKTGEKSPVYSDPVKVSMNVGRDTGDTSLEEYGTNIPYTRTLITDDLDTPINEQAVLWIDVDTTESYNYIVTNVSKTLNCVRITARRVKI